MPWLLALVGGLLFSLSTSGYAQFGNTSQNSLNQNGNRQAGTLGYQDTSRLDTSQARKVARGVRSMRPLSLMRSDVFLDSVPDLDIWQYTFLWDEADTLPGFKQRLGQSGKPYQRYQYGLPSRLLNESRYRDPLTGQEWVYLLDPYTQIPHYDTKTLLADISFHQTAGDLQFLKVDLSQNVTPFWNWTFRYRRRSGEGRFLNSVTDQYNIAISTYFRSYNQKLALFVNGGFNQVRDQISGGLVEGGFAPRDSLLSSGVIDNAEQVLTTPKLFIRARTFTLGGSYRLFGDSVNNLSLVAGANYVAHSQLWEDRNTQPDNLYLATQNRAYANIFFNPNLPSQYLQFENGVATGGIAFVQTRYDAAVREASGGIRFSARLWRFLSRHDVQARYNSTTYWGGVASPVVFGINRQGIRYVASTGDTGQVQIFRLNWQLDYSRNNRMANELRAEATAAWTFGRRKYDVKDSILRNVRGRWVKRPVNFKGEYAPLQFQAHGSFSTQNPTVFDRFWSTLTFESNPNLENEQVTLLRGAVKYTRPLTSRKGVAFLPTFVQLDVFTSLRNRAILYDDLGAAFQLPSGSTLTWQGIALSGRVRISRIYLDANVTAQQGRGPAAAYPYAENQPELYGRVSLYYENKIFRQGNTFLHAGFDTYFFTSYRGLHFDPSTVRFYPQRALQLGDGLRVDAVLTANILSAVAFVKIQNFTAGLFQPNYVTTPYYPELLSTFVWGVGWRMYD